MALQDSLEQLRGFDWDLDPQNIGSWPAAVKLLFMLIALVVVLLVGYNLFITDKLKSLEREENKEVQLRKEYEDKAGQAANLDAYLQQKREMEAAFGALLRQLPSDTEVPGLLEDITRTALDNELTIESIDLKPERKTEFYIELPIDIVVEGGYHKIGAFVSSVANLSRIVTLHDFNISPQQSNQNLRMQILAKTYRYLEDAE